MTKFTQGRVMGRVLGARAPAESRVAVLAIALVAMAGEIAGRPAQLVRLWRQSGRRRDGRGRRTSRRRSERRPGGRPGAPSFIGPDRSCAVMHGLQTMLDAGASVDEKGDIVYDHG